MVDASYANTRRIRSYCETRNDYRFWYVHMWACAIDRTEWDKRFWDLVERL